MEDTRDTTENPEKDFVTDPEQGVALLKGEQPKQTEPPKEEFTPSPVWDTLKEVRGEEFKMPEDLNKENEKEKLAEILKGKGAEPELEGDRKEIYEKLQDPNFDLDSYVEQKNKAKQLLSMPSKDFMATVLKERNGHSEKNPNGWTDEDISTYLEGKSKIDLDIMADREKENIAATVKETPKKEEKKEDKFDITDSYIKEITEKNKETEVAKTIFNDTFKKDEFDKKFHEYSRIDPKTKTNKISQLINNDNTLYEMIAAHEYVKSLSASKKTKEEKNKEIEDTTTAKPGASGSSGVPDNAQQDISALK